MGISTLGGWGEKLGVGAWRAGQVMKGLPQHYPNHSSHQCLSKDLDKPIASNCLNSGGMTQWQVILTVGSGKQHYLSQYMYLRGNGSSSMSL